MHENVLLSHIFTRTRSLVEAFPQVLLGPGDDCAVVDANEGSPILLKVDQVIEHRHFTSQTPFELIARKALARPLSDIAAMAGSPVAALAACILPRRFSQDKATELFDALHHAAVGLGLPIVGGDVATSGNADAPIALSISLIGRVHPRRGPVRRDTAAAGDFVYVTGAIGDTYHADPTDQHPFPGGGHHLTFTPRLREAAWLAEGLDDDLHAMMDISDGLGLDAARLARASGVRIELDASSIPLRTPSRGPRQSLADGEDYELLFTAAAGATLPRTIASLGTPITRIGVVTQGSGCVLRHEDKTLDISDAGWEHG